MIFNEFDNSLVTYKHDYGVPVIFSAGEAEGFSVGDKIIFVFRSESIPDKEFTVDRSDFSFSLKLSKAEADAIQGTIWYSAKRYSESGEFLETLLNGKLIIKETIKWQSS